jgi:hypothetical protein
LDLHFATLHAQRYTYLRRGKAVPLSEERSILSGQLEEKFTKLERK